MRERQCEWMQHECEWSRVTARFGNMAMENILIEVRIKLKQKETLGKGAEQLSQGMP